MKALKLFLSTSLVAGTWLAANADAAASSNSMVRFRLSHGSTRVGDIDVELLDQDKPITVSNFLHYVQTGAYDRTFLHRCVPGFIVQGGLYAVDNPYPSTLFQAMTRIPEGPPITNEFGVGPRIGNSYGTLAMALSSTNIGGNYFPVLDSATASWFFNTVDNSDQLDPFYVVFGRVKAGSTNLNFFNTLSEDKGIINMYGLNYLFSACDYPNLAGEGDVALQGLPVSYHYFDCPYYSTLFNVQIIMLDGRDVAPPRITITSPAAGVSISNDAVTVTATVTDNVAVKSVRAYLGTAGPVAAVLNTNNNLWTVILTNVPPGTNAFVLEATDASGNRATTTREFFRSVLVRIGLFLGGTSCTDGEVVTNMITNLVVRCGGTILGAANGQLLEIGRGYTFTAKPAPGNLFAGWFERGALVSSYPIYPFIIDANNKNRNVTAVFNTNFFPHVKGTYTGLFYDNNQVEEWNSGFFTLTVGDLGAYSAKVTINNKTFPLSGKFDSSSGAAINLLIQNPLTSSNDLFVRLNLDLWHGNDHLSGTFSNYYSYAAFVTNGPNPGITRFTNRWASELHAYRPVFTSASPAPQAGKYTLLITADTNSTDGPFGDGYGRVTVNTKGSLTFNGSLADGTKVTQKVPISKNGDWPLYLNLYKNKGMLLSRIIIDTNRPDDLSGLMNWFKRTQVAKYYGAGFTNESMIVGSRFTPPTGANRLLGLTAAVVGFTNGNLTADFANDVTLNAAGKVTNQDLNKLSLSLNKSSGLMSGSATPPAGGKSILFKGAVLQKQNRGAGFFLGTNTSGRISVGQ